jgi:hypothetical protein
MKPSRRNRANAEARAAKRASPPRLSRYAAKQHRDPAREGALAALLAGRTTRQLEEA